MSHLSSKEVRQKFLDYFGKNGHKVVPSSSLIPTDPSVLLTTAGMQQFKPYFVGTADPMKDFGSQNTASVQKCFRTSDIDEVGDETHLTFFEMLGNFSFGGYFKEEAIEYAYDFITSKDWMNLEIDYVTVFAGSEEDNLEPEIESEVIWADLGVRDIRKAGKKDNFWGPTGSEGPCGPTTEIYVKNSAGQSVEVWNLVFNQYYYRPNTNPKCALMKSFGVDTGMGLERLAMIVQNKPSIFETDLFSPIFEVLPGSMDEKTRRIFADHARGISFLISDGVRPSNKEAGYILRRLMRRLIAYRIEVSFKELFNVIVREYGNFYNGLNLENIISVFEEEGGKFYTAIEKGKSKLEAGLDRLRRYIQEEGSERRWQHTAGKIYPDLVDIVFQLFQTFGVPPDVSFDELEHKLGVNFDRAALQQRFQEMFLKHQEVSRAGMEKKFGGHGLILNTGELKAGNEEELEKVLRLHTATHLLQRALREVLGPEVKQAGSDITPERTRFDFSFSRKLTPEEIKKAEDLVNEKIKEDLPVNFKEMPKSEAEKTGALYFFKEKYPDPVKVYYVGKDIESAWSKEFCGGPHVGHTGVIGHFKISKEETIGAGTRRIRGIVE